MYSCVYVIYAREGMTADEFADHWINIHGEIAKRQPRLQRLELFPVTSSEGELGPAVAGFAVMEFLTKEDFNFAGAGDVMDESLADVPNFARHIAAYTVTGHRIVEPRTDQR